MGHLSCQNPYTLETDTTYQLLTFEQANSKILLAQQGFETWKNVTVSQRVLLLKSALNYFKERQDEIAKDITDQMGRPFHQARGEINGLLERANHLCAVAPQILAPESLPPKVNFQRQIKHQPLGLIFVIAPWNYPLLTAINSVATALLAGNTVLLKHASQTPAIGIHFENAFGQLGSYGDLLHNLIIDHQTTKRIIEESHVDHVVFTGSVTGGKIIHQATAKRFMGCNLELGGKDGAYIAEDANLDDAAACVVDGAMFNSGQSCCGIERVYVHTKVYDAVLEKILALVDQYRLGDPHDPTTNMGPLANKNAALTMTSQIEDAIAKGAQVLRGGKPEIINGSTFFQPTVLTNVNHQMAVMKEENFGPILPIMKISNDVEAVLRINDSSYGLTSAIFTENAKRASSLADKIQTGTVFLNRCDYLDPALPWTGLKDSGLGSSLSQYGFHALTRLQAIHFKLK